VSDDDFGKAALEEGLTDREVPTRAPLRRKGTAGGRPPSPDFKGPQSHATLPRPSFSPSAQSDKDVVVAILGLGLMGASLGMSFKASGGAGKRQLVVKGWNRTGSVSEKALHRGAIDRACQTVEEAVEDADFVFVATPVSTIPELALRAASAAPRGCIVSDVGSVKQKIVEAVEESLPEGVHFIGGHPMCGSELQGLEAARPDMYRGATWVLTPSNNTDSQALASLSGLVSSIGAKVLVVPPDRHDRFVAMVSHLPHVVAGALTTMVAERSQAEAALSKMAAGGFRDLTRIASGSPEIWTDICSWNTEAILEAIESLESQLGTVKRWLKEGNVSALSGFLEAARAARADLFFKRAVAEELWEVWVAVADRPGTLARVTTLVGSEGINIADIEIVHPMDAGPDEPGVLRLSIEGEQEARRAAEALKAEGFQASVRPGLKRTGSNPAGNSAERLEG
jgi:prephenate dehydrogenase